MGKQIGEKRRTGAYWQGRILTGDYLQECGVPARDFAGLAAQSEMERRGNRRGERGLFIGVAGASN
jgi:hypothetical protein